MSLRVVEEAGRTDIGRRRESNEDSMRHRPPIFIVADGMGGAQAGEVASNMAIELFGTRWPADEGVSAVGRLLAIAHDANRRIYERAQSDPELAGMGTTLTALVVGDYDEVVLLSVGDSRAYRLRDGVLEKLSHDDSFVAELVRRGLITAEEAARHPARSQLLYALGTQPEVEIEARVVVGRAEDVYLLCSDGLTGVLPEPDIAETLARRVSLQDAARQLIDAANARGGPDNITVVLFRLAPA